MKILVFLIFLKIYHSFENSKVHISNLLVETVLLIPILLYLWHMTNAECHKMPKNAILWHFMIFGICQNISEIQQYAYQMNCLNQEIWDMNFRIIKINHKNQKIKNTRILNFPIAFWSIFLYKIKSFVAPVDDLGSYKIFAWLPNSPIETYIPIYRKIHESKGNRGTLMKGSIIILLLILSKPLYWNF